MITHQCVSRGGQYVITCNRCLLYVFYMLLHTDPSGCVSVSVQYIITFNRCCYMLYHTDILTYYTHFMYCQYKTCYKTEERR